MLRLKKGGYLMSSPTKTTSDLLITNNNSTKISAKPLAENRIKIQNQLDEQNMKATIAK